MKKTEALTEEMEHDQLSSTITYLLAGLAGGTSGHKINSVAVQQAGLSGFRVVIRAVGVNDRGDTVHVVSFTTGSEPGDTLLLAERAYRDNVIQWKVDRFAEGNGDDGPSKNGQLKLVLVD